MSAYQCWEEQREPLRGALKDQNSMADVVYAVRHALLQTEQNTLAELTDDVLRQQTGVLFSMAKSAVGFLDTPVSATAWTAQSRKEEKRGKGRLTLTGVCALCILFCGLLCYFRGLLLGWIAALAALIAGSAALLAERKARRGPSDDKKAQVKVTLSPDGDRLLSVIDGQMRAIDRCANDFAYLNDSLREGGGSAGTAMLTHVYGLLEALYEYDENERAPVTEAVSQMLSDMGLKALDYSEDSRKLFTALPSKNTTRTIAPAIVSAEDYRLLKHGVAAVQTDAA